MTSVRRLEVCGYTIIYKPAFCFEPRGWAVTRDDEYTNLPVYYLSTEETSDRFDYLRSRNIEARVAALIAEATDDAEKVEAHRNRKDGCPISVPVPPP